MRSSSWGNPKHPVGFIQHQTRIYLATRPTEITVSREFEDIGLGLSRRTEISRQDYSVKCDCGWESPLAVNLAGHAHKVNRMLDEQAFIDYVGKAKALLQPCQHFHLVGHGALA
nr:hypothetical protein [Rhodococcus sp. (in: high G+C Gram-positive bacteria)]